MSLMAKKKRIWKKRNDGVRQRYWVGRKKKGLKRKYGMAWSKGTKTDPPTLEGRWSSEKGSEEVYEKKRVLMDPDEFLQRQYEQSGYTDRVTFDEWVDVDQDRVDEMKKMIQSKDIEIPIPLEQYTPYGERRDFQEGRHRGLAAKQLGIKVPVVLGRKKFAPWDRAAPDKPYEHKPAHFHTKPDKIDNMWDREKDKWEEDEA